MGLIGGSLGLALRKAGWPVIGWSPSPKTVRLALELGAIEAAGASPEEAAAQAELIVLAGPIRSLPQLFRAAASGARPGSVVTDVASVKGQVMRWAADLLPPGLDFVGGHPMAGRERQGVAAATAELFNGCTYCLIPTSDRSLRVGRDLATAVGARPVQVDPQEHDRAVAATSHLPFVVATALVQAVAGDLEGLAGQVAAGGFRDTTRVAAGSVEMHADICRYNAPALVGWIERFEQALGSLKTQLEEPALEAVFADARQHRLAWAERKAERTTEHPA